jgi:hypothetical protein
MQERNKERKANKKARETDRQKQKIEGRERRVHAVIPTAVKRTATKESNG